MVSLRSTRLFCAFVISSLLAQTQVALQQATITQPAL